MKKQLNIKKKENIDNENINIEKEIKEDDIFIDKNIDKEIAKKYRSLKIKRILIFLSIFLIFFSLLSINLYYIFGKQDIPIKELATKINIANKTTNFPTDGVEGYLKRTINTISEKNIYIQDNIRNAKFNTSSVQIVLISKKNNNLANVYFKATFSTSSGENWHNFMIPLYYDNEKYTYAPAGQIQITNAFAESSEYVENNNLSFKSLESLKPNDIKSATVFMKNLFTLVFNEKSDYSQFYTGKTILGDNTAKFVDIVSMEIYEGTNQAGFNARVTYKLSLEEGITYTNISYLYIEKSGNSWILKSMI